MLAKKVWRMLGIVAVALLAARAPAQEAGPLRAGAAKIDITPLTGELPGFYTVWATRYEGVHDPIYARALVVSNGRVQAALVATDLVEMGDTTALRSRIERELGIPADHVMITAAHDHGAPRAGPITANTSSAGGRPYSPPAYVRRVDDDIVRAIREARAAARPAEVGVGTGRADININRHHYNGKNWSGPDYDMPSDKSVRIVKFSDTSGAPIAILLNYAVHAVVAGPEAREVTGDLSGAAERVVERHYGDKAVALWILGPAGDENPRYLADAASAERDGADFNWRAVDALGTVLGIEAFQTADRIGDMTGTARIVSAQSSFACPLLPPRQQPPRAAGAPPMFPPNPDFHETIARPDHATIQLSLLRINDIALVGVSGEVFTQIYRDLQRRSPLADTIMVTMTNDRVGYIGADSEYDTSYANAEFQRGCAGPGIVDGLMKLMDR